MKEGSTIKSARRVLEVLEYFAETHAPATVTEVCAALDYPQSSTSVLLSSLESLGYLRVEKSSRRYVPTVRVMMLGAWMNDEIFSHGALLPQVDLLRRRLRMPVLIGMRQGIHLRLVVSSRSPGPQTVFFSAGILRPICRSAMGKVLLAKDTDKQIELTARRANAAEQEHAVDIKQLLTEVRQIRRDGWSETLGYPEADRATLAIALPVFPNQPDLAIGIGTSKNRLIRERETIIEEIRSASARIAELQANPA